MSERCSVHCGLNGATVHSQSIKFSIADKSADSAQLAAFFRNNLTDDYISHSELQGYRAVALNKWSPDIGAVLEKEITARLGPPQDDFPTKTSWKGVILGHDGPALVAIAFVTLTHQAAVPYGIIEDVVVCANLRGHGYGAAAMGWIIDNLRKASVQRVFLESGVANTRAHHLFETLGFSTVSIVMMRDL